MLNWLISSSLRMRAIVVALAVLLLAAGAWQMRRMSLDVVPEFSPLTLQVQTEALGLSTAEVESLITVPLEADLLNGVPWLESIESESITGLSSIEMFFLPGTDLMRARQMVQERLTQAHALPNVSRPPVLLQPVSSASRIMNIGLSSKTVPLIEMSVQARWNIVPRLVGVPGVANVSVWGMRDRQVQVQVDPARLHDKGITLDQIIKTAGEAVWVSPLTFLNSSTPGAGGFIDTPNQRLGVRHVSPTATPDSFAMVPVHGTSFPLRNVARVVEDNQPLIGNALLKGGTGLMLVVEKFPGANTAEVTRGVEAALRELGPGMQGIDVDTRIYRPAGFIERAAKNLAMGAGVAYVLLVITLGLLWGSWRAALVAAVVTPVSLMTAVWVLKIEGTNLNMMVVAGLMLAVAVVVDDAVMDVDQFMRKLSQIRQDTPASLTLAIMARTAVEVRGPMLFATAIIVLGVLPALFIHGPAAAFFQPLFWSYMLAVLASLAVALTLTPTLALMLLARAPLPAQEKPKMRGALMGAIERGAQRLAGKTLHAPVLAFALAGVGVAMGALVWMALPRDWVPSFKETDVVVSWQGAPGTSLPETNRITAAVMRDLQAIKGVKNVAAQVGRAVQAYDVADVNEAEVWVSIDPQANYEATLQAMRDAVAAFPGLHAEVNTFLSTRMREALTGGEESIAVRVYGHDQDIVRRKAEEVRDVLAKIDGISNPHVEPLAEKTAIEVKVMLDKARNHGLKPGDVRRAASALMSGITVGALFEDQKVFDVVVLGTPNVRNNLSALRNLLIDTPNGGQVRLADVAEVRTVASPSVIRRQGVSRRVDVDAEVVGGNVNAISAEVARRIKDIPFPFEYHAKVVGEHFSQREAWQSLQGYMAAAMLIAWLVVQAALRSWRLTALSLIGVPVAMAGGFAAVWLGGAGLTIGAALGFIAVLAVAVRHGISLVRHWQMLESQGDQQVPFHAGVVQQGLSERLPAMAASLIGTSVVALPFVIMGNVAGLEIVHSMAQVMLGGMVSTAVLMWVCVPALYLRYSPRLEADVLPGDTSAPYPHLASVSSPTAEPAQMPQAA